MSLLPHKVRSGVRHSAVTVIYVPWNCNCIILRLHRLAIPRHVLREKFQGFGGRDGYSGGIDRGRSRGRRPVRRVVGRGTPRAASVRAGERHRLAGRKRPARRRSRGGGGWVSDTVRVIESLADADIFLAASLNHT